MGAREEILIRRRIALDPTSKDLIDVEYLRNMYYAKIDTGIHLVPGMEIEIKCRLNSISSNQTICGAIQGDGLFNLVLCAQRNTSGKIFCQIGITGQCVYSISTNTNIHTYKVTFTNDKQRIQVDGGTVYSGPSTPVTPTRSLYLFNRNSPFGDQPAFCDIFYFKAWLNSDLIADYKPVRDSLYTGYMYDSVTHGLFGNITFAEAFSVGPDLDV